MKISSVRQIYLQPVTFKTISFHHQSQYFLDFQVLYKQSHMKDFIEAYPQNVPIQAKRCFNRKKLLKPKMKNSIQTEKFLILFNDQSITIRGGCKFLIQTDRSRATETKGNKIESKLIITLYRQHIQRDQNQQIKINQNAKIQKVGEETIMINLSLTKDYSQNSCYRHIVFTNDQFFSSCLLYIDFAHMGLKLRNKKADRLSELNLHSEESIWRKIKQITNDCKEFNQANLLRDLLPFKQIKKLYKLLISDRVSQLHRIVNLYYATIASRKQYINLYQIQQLQNIESTSFLNPMSIKKILMSLQYLSQHANPEQQSNQYFYKYYETDDIDVVYSSIFNQSKLIALNVYNVWNSLIHLKLKTLPEQFQTYALKFKIDRMRHITKLYSSIDQNIYQTQIEIQQRLQNHAAQRIKVCQNSRFYNANQAKHSMLTFHSQKLQQVISNTQEKDQSQILVILVHGYKGSQRDMAKIKSFINTFTSINFLPLQTLNNNQNEDIKTLGKKGAQQVVQYLAKKPYITSINMIGFSLGGIIAKSILTFLSTHKQKFNLFLTLASPHLGISELQNCLVSCGVLWMNKITRVKNMKELCLKPLSKSKSKEEITLLQLSNQQVLTWFKHVVVIGSNQDTYVPKYSALLAYQGGDRVIREIQQKTLTNLKSLDRITVWFEYEQNFVDKITGRKGHISFIEDDTFLQYIIIKYLQFF